jgi:DNA-binding transcriptional MerR regulator
VPQKKEMIDLRHEQLLSFEDAARRLGCSIRTVRHWAAVGFEGRRLEFIKLGRLLRTSVEAINRFSTHEHSEPDSRLTPSQRNRQRARQALHERHGS